MGREVIKIHDGSALTCDIHHRDDYDHRHLQLAHEKREIEIALYRGCVYHIYVQICLVGKHIFKASPFILARSGQGINARKVHYLDRPRLGKNEFTLLLLDGYARPIPDMLMGTGKTVEHCGLSAVGVSYEAYRLHLTSPFSRTLTLMTPTSSLRRPASPGTC